MSTSLFKNSLFAISVRQGKWSQISRKNVTINRDPANNYKRTYETTNVPIIEGQRPTMEHVEVYLNGFELYMTKMLLGYKPEFYKDQRGYESINISGTISDLSESLNESYDDMINGFRLTVEDEGEMCLEFGYAYNFETIKRLSRKNRIMDEIIKVNDKSGFKLIRVMELNGTDRKEEINELLVNASKYAEMYLEKVDNKIISTGRRNAALIYQAINNPLYKVVSKIISCLYLSGAEMNLRLLNAVYAGKNASLQTALLMFKSDTDQIKAISEQGLNKMLYFGDKRSGKIQSYNKDKIDKDTKLFIVDGQLGWSIDTISTPCYGYVSVGLGIRSRRNSAAGF